MGRSPHTTGTVDTTPDASSTVKGKTKLSVEPASDPIAVGDNDPRLALYVDYIVADLPSTYVEDGSPVDTLTSDNLELLVLGDWYPNIDGTVLIYNCPNPILNGKWYVENPGEDGVASWVLRRSPDDLSPKHGQIYVVFNQQTSQPFPTVLTIATADPIEYGTDAIYMSELAYGDYGVNSFVNGAINTHIADTDPHGDRAYTDGLIEDFLLNLETTEVLSTGSYIETYPNQWIRSRTNSGARYHTLPGLTECGIGFITAISDYNGTADTSPITVRVNVSDGRVFKFNNSSSIQLTRPYQTLIFAIDSSGDWYLLGETAKGPGITALTGANPTVSTAYDTFDCQTSGAYIPAPPPTTLNKQQDYTFKNTSAGNVYIRSGRNEIQSVTANATGGTFTLTFGGYTTGTIAYNASSATVTSALEALTSIGAGNVSVSGPTVNGNSRNWQVTFQGALSATNVAQMTGSGAGLTGGTGILSIGTSTSGLSYTIDGDITYILTPKEAVTLQINATTSASLVTGSCGAGGTYTPTLTNVTNLSASTAYQCQYMRVGKSINVSGRVAIDPTATGAIELGISLPVGSNFGAVEDCAGTAVSVIAGDDALYIEADTTNDRIALKGNATDLTNHSVYFNLTYQLI